MCDIFLSNEVKYDLDDWIIIRIWLMKQFKIFIESTFKELKKKIGLVANL